MGKRGAMMVAAEEVRERAVEERLISQSAAARLIYRSSGPSLRSVRRKFRESVEWALAQTTPYGDVLKSIAICIDDRPWQLPYVCPYAWLFLACSMSQCFAQLLVATQSQGLPGSICIYSDEVTPGNALRPDAGRQFLSIYWGVSQLPDWFRSRSGFWQTLLFLPCTTLEKITGGLSALYIKVLECFWGHGEMHLLRLGVRVLLRGSLVHLRFSFGFFLSDEKAEKEALGIKGAGGTKICVSCQNCVRTLAEIWCITPALT